MRGSSTYNGFPRKNQKQYIGHRIDDAPISGAYVIIIRFEFFFSFSFFFSTSRTSRTDPSSRGFSRCSLQNTLFIKIMQRLRAAFPDRYVATALENVRTLCRAAAVSLSSSDRSSRIRTRSVRLLRLAEAAGCISSRRRARVQTR